MNIACLELVYVEHTPLRRLETIYADASGQRI